MNKENKEQNRNKSIDKWLFILMQVFIPVAFGVYSIMLGQDTSCDFQNYHLYNAYAFLNGRLGFDLFPPGLATCLNPYLDLVYFEGIRYAAPWIVGFTLGVVQGLNFIVLLHICKYCLRAIDVKHARWAIVLALLGVLSVGIK